MLANFVQPPGNKIGVKSTLRKTQVINLDLKFVVQILRPKHFISRPEGIQPIFTRGVTTASFFGT